MELYGIKKIGINMKLRISRQKIVKILAALYIYLSKYITKRLISYRPIMLISYLTLNYLQIIRKSIFSGYYLELNI